MLTALRNGNDLLRGEDRFASRRQHGWCEDDQFFAEVYIEKVESYGEFCIADFTFCSHLPY